MTYRVHMTVCDYDGITHDDIQEEFLHGFGVITRGSRYMQAPATSESICNTRLKMNIHCLYLHDNKQGMQLIIYPVLSYIRNYGFKIIKLSYTFIYIKSYVFINSTFFQVAFNCSYLKLIWGLSKFLKKILEFTSYYTYKKQIR